MFKWQEQYLKSERSENKIHIFELTCNVLFVIDIRMTAFFDDFLKISDNFPKISRDLPILFHLSLFITYSLLNPAGGRRRMSLKNSVK